MNIPRILNYLRPGDEWSLDGETYEGLTWLSDTTKPSEEELQEAESEAESAHAEMLARRTQNRNDAIDHALSLGFSYEMISVMFPALMIDH